MRTIASDEFYALESAMVDATLVDPRIKYPSYKSFDEIIDVEWLKSLDGYLTTRIERRAAARRDALFYTGPYRLENAGATLPGARMIYLSQSTQPENYFDLDRTELWKPTEAVNEFAELMDFIETLPFQARGRMMIIYDDVPRPVTAHRDHTETEVLHDFIWFRTNFNKSLYMLNYQTGERLDVTSHSAWFDSVNQFHGCDAELDLSFSIRVDGIFTDELKQQIPLPAFNLASAPALWVSAKK